MEKQKLVEKDKKIDSLQEKLQKVKAQGWDYFKLLDEHQRAIAQV